LTVTTSTPSCGSSAAANCYSNTDAINAERAKTTSGKNIEYVFATGTSGFKVWKEVSGSRILKANGLDAWQKSLNSGGKGHSGTDFTQYSSLKGRVCPPNVYINDSNKFATDRCMYYGGIENAQKLYASTGTAWEDFLHTWNNATSSLGTAGAWYEGNVKVCNDKGMRLPALYETNIVIDASSSNLPQSDGTPVFATTSGVPGHSSFLWSATAALNSSSGYSGWQGTSWTYANYNVNNYNLRCVLPGS
jgi:hypothetical protein